MTSELAARPRDAVVGRPLPHESAVLHATGAAVYTDDLAPTTSGVLTAWPVQSEHAHALVALDIAPALDVPGVVRVLTADDVPGVNDAGAKGDEPLFPTEAMYHGHALAWVLGESADAARAGAAAVQVAYEPLPSIITVAEAIEAGSFQGISPTIRRGDAAAALARAPHVFEGTSIVGGQEHFSSRRTRRSPASTPRGRCSSSRAPSIRRKPRRSSRTCSAFRITASPSNACAWAAASAARRCSPTGSQPSPRSAPS
ncbi:hypothetical protein GCM10025870_10200 [Agromyces marinus]|uniref:Aldehyde oxidase/xanthine dehydrogenase a/b hammerhead domain-containing protein n=1 Tax=Agromyces marinus TaxID=1389020 RepID=A0ABN6Y9C5_9MICO|nr:hypothetical protein GCM10025870_10200 [Agromyces marinus]